MGLGFGTNGWTAVDCSDGPSICAVSVRPSTRAGESPAVLAAAEGDSLRELMTQVDRSLPVVATLARGQYQLRVMPEPVVPSRELLSTLRWSLATDSDDPMASFNLAWMPIPTEEQLPSRPRQGYAVTAATTPLMERLTKWRQAGMRPKVVDIRETALRNVAGALERGGEGVALVSQDADGVGIVFTHQGSLYLDRYIELPLAELQAADAEGRARLYSRVATQLMRSIDVIARTYPFMPVRRVVVAPEPQPVGLVEYLGAQLPVSVETLELAQVFDVSRVPALKQSRALQARCLVPLGAALRPRGV
jgi:MSHA biogenesis protein MshI